MLKRITLAAAFALSAAGGVFAAGGEAKVDTVPFSFKGPFGAFDQNQLQRGLQIYTEICASCHGLKYVPIRTLGDEGGPHLPEDQVFAYAATLEVWDPELNDGEGDFRTATPTDHFPEVTSAAAPDLSLMAKARAGFHGPYGLGINQLTKGMGGPDYIVALLTGYQDPPECAPEDMDGSYNVAFTAGGYPDECKDEKGNHKYPGSWIGMGQPLWGEDVEFADGHANDLEHVAEDVAAFLTWTAEPKMMARKQAGLTGFIFLTALATLLYLTNKRLWAPIKGKEEE